MKTNDGETHDQLVKSPLGAHENPITPERLRVKFENFAGTVLGEDERASILDGTFDLPAIEDVRSFTRQL